MLSLPGFSEVTQFLAKLLYTGILGAGIFLLGTEIWRVWLDRTLVLSPFSYLKDGVESRESGLGFTRLVSHDLRLLRELYAPQRTGGSTSTPSTDQIGTGASLEIPVARTDLATDVEIQAYGIQVGKLLRRLSRWVNPPHEIVGNLSERGDEFDLFAQVQGSAGDGVHWSLTGYSDKNELSNALACRILRHLAASQSPKLFGLEAGGQRVDDGEFCLFLSGLKHYQIYRHQVGTSAADAAKAQLEKAREVVEKLLKRPPRFAFSHKLAAYVLREQQVAEAALQQVEMYEQVLERAGQTDSEIAELREALATQVAALAPVVPSAARTPRDKIRPLRPGISLSGVRAGAGTLGAIVRDGDGARYALTVAHVVTTEGEIVVQPGIADGGSEQDRVGRVERLLTPRRDVTNRTSAALIRLDQTIQASNDIPDIGPIVGVVDDPTALLGQPITLVGRSGTHEGTVTTFDVELVLGLQGGPTRFDGLIATSRLSRPGDSGAPLITPSRELLGFVFAGSRDQTIVMPAKPVLEALSVELVAEPGSSAPPDSR